MHGNEHAQREGVSTRLLCKQDLLRHIASTDRAPSPAIREIQRRSIYFCRARSGSHRTVSRRIASEMAAFLNRQMHHALQADTRATLHVSNLIQRA
jgi:hypothetical protein